MKITLWVRWGEVMTCHAELLKLLLKSSRVSRRQFTTRRRHRFTESRRRRRRRWVGKPVRRAGSRTHLGPCSRRTITSARRRRRPMTDGVQDVCRRGVLLRTSQCHKRSDSRVGLLDRVDRRHRRMSCRDDCTVYWAILGHVLHNTWCNLSLNPLSHPTIAHAEVQAEVHKNTPNLAASLFCNTDMHDKSIIQTW